MILFATSQTQTFGVQMETTDRMVSTEFIVFHFFTGSISSQLLYSLLFFSQVILTPEQQERIRLNRERALAKRRAAQEKQAEQNNTQTGIRGLQYKDQNCITDKCKHLALFLMRSDKLNEPAF